MQAPHTGQTRYYYIALDRAGQESNGSLMAASQTDAAAVLRGRQLIVTQIGDAPITSAEDRALKARSLLALVPVMPVDKARLMRDLALMVGCGVTILQALQVLERQAFKPRIRKTLGLAAEAVRDGQPLSEAFTHKGTVVPPIARQLIAGAEKSGELEQVLKRSAEHIERRAQLIAHVLSALLYPAIVLWVSVVVVLFLVLVVIPKVGDFLTRRGKTLPPSTQFLIDLSDFLIRFALPIAGVFVAAAIGVALFRATKRGRVVFDRMLCWLPGVRPAAMSHLCWTLSMLLESGVTLVNGLQITADTMSNRHVSRSLNRAADKVYGGSDLQRSLDPRVVPPMLLEIVGVGERTGAMAEVFDQAGSHYQERLQTIIKRLSVLVEPALILSVGTVVGFVYYSFFKALLAIAT